MTFRGRRTIRVLLTAVLLALPNLAALPSAPLAQSQPDEAPADISLAWPTLGLNSAAVVSVGNATEAVVPVPTGMTAVRLRGVIHAPENIGAGFLEIDDSEGRFLALVELPVLAAGQPVRPFDVDIAPARRDGSAVRLSMTVRPNDFARDCGPSQRVTVTDLTTVYAGDEPPSATVADFFPSVLQRVNIIAPTDADTSEQQAVLTLVSTLTRLYSPQPVEIRVVSRPRGTAPGPTGQMERAIVVERDSAGVTVVEPRSPLAYLRISGRGDELTSQISLLENDLQKLAQVPSARVDQPSAPTPPAEDTLTFDELGLQGRADVLRRSNFNVGVDRAALGGDRIDSVQVHLLADYTPVADHDAASVVVRAGDVIVYRAPLDDSGHVDAKFEIGNQQLGQRISLDFEVNFTPGQECGPLIAPMTFAVDPRSTLTLVRGGAPLGGFDALPSEFSPEFFVALDGSSPDQLGYAARVVNEIARLTDTTLTPKVVDVKAAAEARSGALIVANSAAIEQTSLDPPIAGNRSSVDFGLPEGLRAEIANGLGSVQAFADPARDRTVVLVTTTGAWTLVDPLFDYIDRFDQGWAALSGDVLAAGAAGTAVNVTIRAEDAQTSPPGDSAGRAPWPWVFAAAAGVALVASLTTALLRRRHRTPAQ
ncbi:hypothetical protein MPNTM1_01959 [Mycolicibacterium parafortuitum]|uniref:hypothetical protein n=1 Tax=Mycolicibacterium parafortuitum TaxID=39692 RepID=UPI0032C43487